MSAVRLVVSFFCLLIWSSVISCKPRTTTTPITEQVYSVKQSWSGVGSGGKGKSFSARNHIYLLWSGAGETNFYFTLKSSTVKLTYAIWPVAPNAILGFPEAFQDTPNFTYNVGFSPGFRGQYILIIGTDTPGETGDYELTVKGVEKPIAQVKQQLYEQMDQKWATEGGGGSATSNAFNSEVLLSPKNPAYTFTVSDSYALVDVLVESSGTEVAYALTNISGELVAKNDGTESMNRQKLARTHQLPTGSYTLHVSTKLRDISSLFTVRVIGNIENFSKLPASTNRQFSGAFPKRPPDFTEVFRTSSTPNVDVYKLVVGANNTVLDIGIKPTLKPILNLYKADGTQVASARFDYMPATQREFTVPTLAAGTYYLIASNGSPTTDLAYQLSVWGDLLSLERL